MRIGIRELVGDAVPAGSANGAIVLAKAIQKLSSMDVLGIVFLDFRDVEYASSSFLREAVLGLRDYCRSNRPNVYPVVANATKLVREDLLEVLMLKRDAVLACDLDSDGHVHNANILGVLDEIQRATLDAVAELGETDAASLAASDTTQNAIGATAWNNRLSSLAERGLLIELRRGRGKKYRALLKDLEHGN